MPLTYVRITHPDLGEAEVIESTLPVWEERGWTRAPEDGDGARSRRRSPRRSSPPATSSS